MLDLNKIGPSFEKNLGMFHLFFSGKFWLDLIRCKLATTPHYSSSLVWIRQFVLVRLLLMIIIYSHSLPLLPSSSLKIVVRLNIQRPNRDPNSNLLSSLGKFNLSVLRDVLLKRFESPLFPSLSFAYESNRS